jgi:hypothetical protein
MRALFVLALTGCLGEPTSYPDADGDGWCTAPSDVFDTRTAVCEGGLGFGDCNDAAPTVSPDAVEDCNGIDDNCDGILPDSEADLDGDGFLGCRRDCQGELACQTDCDDNDPQRSPGALEVCDDIDNDCNDEVDDIDPDSVASEAPLWFLDSDGDGHGEAGTNDVTRACQRPEGYAEADDDCDDTDSGVHPGADEACNVRDDNCNEEVDEGLTIDDLWVDADNDGFGAEGTDLVRGCATAFGYARNAEDCVDDDADISPGDAEVCNGIDDNCNDEVDDGTGREDWFEDGDGDGFGDPATGALLCAGQAVGRVTDDTDCDDASTAINPGADDACDGTDNDCDGIDNGCATIDRFVVATSRHEGLRNWTTQSSAASCAPADEVYASPTYGVAGGIDAPLTVSPAGRVHLAWTVTTADSSTPTVSIPALGLTGLDADGSFDFSPVSDLVLTLDAGDGVTAEVEIVLDYPYDHPDPTTGAPARCVELTPPGGFFPGIGPALSVEPPYTVDRAACALADDVNEHPDCLLCTESILDLPGDRPFDYYDDGLEFDGSDPSLLGITLPATGAPHYRAYGSGLRVTQGMSLFAVWNGELLGDVWYRVGLSALPGRDADVCDVDEEAMGTTPWIAPMYDATGPVLLADDLYWNFGRSDEDGSFAGFSARNIGNLAQGTYVVPFVEVRMPSADPTARVELSEFELWCCGPDCMPSSAVCVDYDNDGYGPNCGTGDDNWDCDDFDPLRFPSNGGCDTPTWWVLECAIP